MVKTTMVITTTTGKTNTLLVFLTLLKFCTTKIQNNCRSTSILYGTNNTTMVRTGKPSGKATKLILAKLI
jgi:hypothetical protein